jgi:hypothetical protein
MSNFQIEHFLPGSRCSLRDALHGAGPELAAHTLAADSIHRSMEKGLRPKAGAEAGTSLTAPCGGQPSAADLDFFGERPSESDTSQRSATWTLSWGIRRAVLTEAPSFGIPTVNIGNRQKGRLRSASIIYREGYRGRDQ